MRVRKFSESIQAQILLAQFRVDLQEGFTDNSPVALWEAKVDNTLEPLSTSSAITAVLYRWESILHGTGGVWQVYG
jgi:hypothetical protein